MQNKKNNDVIVIDLKEVFYLLLHRAWIIIFVMIIGAIGTSLVSIYLITPMYTSSTKVYLINRQDENKTTYNDMQMGTQLTKDYSILVRGRQVLEQVIDEFKLDIGYSALAELIEVNNPEDTRILEIKVSYHDPELARMLADSLTKLASDRMVEVMEMKKVNVLEEANLPSDPSSPNIIKNTILGGLMGLVLTSVMIIVIHLFNDNIKKSEDIENHLGIAVLGIIPSEGKKEKKKERVSRRRYSFAEIEENKLATD